MEFGCLTLTAQRFEREVCLIPVGVRDVLDPSWYLELIGFSRLSNMWIPVSQDLILTILSLSATIYTDHFQSLLRSLPTSIVLPLKHRLGHSLGEQVTVYLELILASEHVSSYGFIISVSMFMMDLSLASKSFYGYYSVEHFILI